MSRRGSITVECDCCGAEVILDATRLLEDSIRTAVDVREFELGRQEDLCRECYDEAHPERERDEDEERRLA